MSYNQWKGFGECKQTVLSFNPTVCDNKSSGRAIFKTRGNVPCPAEEPVALFFLRPQVGRWLRQHCTPRDAFPLGAVGLTSEMAGLWGEAGQHEETCLSSCPCDGNTGLSVQSGAEAQGRCELVTGGASWPMKKHSPLQPERRL